MFKTLFIQDTMQNRAGHMWKRTHLEHGRTKVTQGA